MAARASDIAAPGLASEGRARIDWADAHDMLLQDGFIEVFGDGP